MRSIQQLKNKKLNQLYLTPVALAIINYPYSDILKFRLRGW